MSERDPSQAWFWTPEWQAGERQADEQAARGEVELYASDEAFLDSLEHPDAQRVIMREPEMP